ncbi:MAG: UDP-2,3-diacylglucosamine diphosphatase LpxI [Calditerrivibrio sp.]|nr:UDP-2,3-diacylglucosamine diphosphatase LpxI [Calditerrivibrio sp.]
MTVGLIAGYGKLPLIAYEKLITLYKDVVVISLLEEVTVDFNKIHSSVYQFSAGQVGKIIKTLKKNNVDKILFAGKVNKTLLYKNLRLDLTAMRLLLELKDRNDDTIMLKIVDEFRKNGIEVLKQSDILRDLFVSKGVISKRKPTKKILEDVAFGYKAAKLLGSIDVGQTVVVKNKAVMALEAIEGTDAAIERGCGLAKRDAVVVKVAKPNQDERFDIPTVGIDTLKKILDNKGICLAIEADATIVVDYDEVRRFCDDNNLIMISYKGEDYES